MDANRHQYVAARFRQLQGYVWLPIAAVFLLEAGWRAGWLPLPGDDRPQVAARWLAGAFFAALVLAYGVQKWYAVRFGVPTPQVSNSPVAPVIAVAICLPLLGSQPSDLRVALPSLFIGAAFALVGMGHYPLRRHYLVPAALFAGFAVLGRFGVAAPVRSVLFDAVIGVSLAVAGIGDHRLFASTFPATFEEAYARV